MFDPTARLASCLSSAPSPPAFDALPLTRHWPDRPSSLSALPLVRRGGPSWARVALEQAVDELTAHESSRPQSRQGSALDLTLQTSSLTILQCWVLSGASGDPTSLIRANAVFSLGQGCQLDHQVTGWTGCLASSSRTGESTHGTRFVRPDYTAGENSR